MMSWLALFDFFNYFIINIIIGFIQNNANITVARWKIWRNKGNAQASQETI